MIIHYNCTIGSFLLHYFLLIYHPYPPSFHEMIFTLVHYIVWWTPLCGWRHFYKQNALSKIPHLATPEMRIPHYSGHFNMCFEESHCTFMLWHHKIADSLYTSNMQRKVTLRHCWRLYVYRVDQWEVIGSVSTLISSMILWLRLSSHSLSH